MKIDIKRGFHGMDENTRHYHNVAVQIISGLKYRYNIDTIIISLTSKGNKTWQFQYKDKTFTVNDRKYVKDIGLDVLKYFKKHFKEYLDFEHIDKRQKELDEFRNDIENCSSK